MTPFRPVSRQQGASLISMLFLAIVVGFVMLMGMRIFPSVNEYLTIRKAVTQIMKAGPASAADIRGAFAKTIEIEYSIHTIGAKDLDIQPLHDGSGFRTSYAYNVEIPVVEPVFILMKFSGSAASGGAKGP